MTDPILDGPSSAVAEVVSRWVDLLVDTSAFNPLVHLRDTKTTTLDLANADAAARTRLLAGQAVRLTELFPEPQMLGDARARRALPRPNLSKHDSITLYRDQGLDDLIRWISSDGLLRDDEALCRAALAELPFEKFGSRIRARLDAAIERTRLPSRLEGVCRKRRRCAGLRAVLPRDTSARCSASSRRSPPSTPPWSRLSGILDFVRTVIAGKRPPEIESWLERRRALGQDLFDEVWEGDYHVGPAPHGLVDDRSLGHYGPAPRRRDCTPAAH
ncbi:MAG: hypothetical protein ACRDZO_02230 [Egibacteraceae bacterium]